MTKVFSNTQPTEGFPRSLTWAYHAIKSSHTHIDTQTILEPTKCKSLDNQTQIGLVCLYLDSSKLTEEDTPHRRSGDPQGENPCLHLNCHEHWVNGLAWNKAFAGTCSLYLARPQGHLRALRVPLLQCLRALAQTLCLVLLFTIRLSSWGQGRQLLAASLTVPTIVFCSWSVFKNK